MSMISRAGFLLEADMGSIVAGLVGGESVAVGMAVMRV